MRAIDPEARTVVSWFLRTHTVRNDRWELTTLPHAGGMADQDARLMDGLAVARATANAVLRDLREQMTTPSTSMHG